MNFLQNAKQSLEYVARDEFWRWIKKEPVALVWFPTLYRIATSETGRSSIYINTLTYIA